MRIALFAGLGCLVASCVSAQVVTNTVQPQSSQILPLPPASAGAVAPLNPRIVDITPVHPGTVTVSPEVARTIGQQNATDVADSTQTISDFGVQPFGAHMVSQASGLSFGSTLKGESSKDPFGSDQGSQFGVAPEYPDQFAEPVKPPAKPAQASQREVPIVGAK